jgi:excisionase family DNA binding protein
VLRLSEPTVRMLIRKNAIGAIRIGRAVRVPHVSLEEYIAEQLHRGDTTDG